MTPAERIPLIKKLAGSISQMPFDEAKLTLGQFGSTPAYPVDYDYNFDAFQGAVRSIEAADDVTLLGLHEYLFGHAAPAPTTTASSAVGGVWEAEKLRLFISHTHPHKQLAASLKFGLAYRGIDAFVAHDDIEPSRDWQSEIETALATCDAITMLLTPDFPGSKWTDQEVGFAVGRSILIIPVNLGLNPYGFIGKYQSLMGMGKGSDVLSDEIIDIVATSDLTGTRYMAPAVRAFAAAGSYNDTRVRYKTLTRLPRTGWPDELLDRLEQAAVGNNQISACMYDREPMPDVLAQFVAERRQTVRA